jgi:hypothetical protein
MRAKVALSLKHMLSIQIQFKACAVNSYPTRIQFKTLCLQLNINHSNPSISIKSIERSQSNQSNQIKPIKSIKPTKQFKSINLKQTKSIKSIKSIKINQINPINQSIQINKFKTNQINQINQTNQFKSGLMHTLSTQIQSKAMPAILRAVAY